MVSIGYSKEVGVLEFLLTRPCSQGQKTEAKKRCIKKVLPNLSKGNAVHKPQEKDLRERNPVFRKMRIDSPQGICVVSWEFS